jgi:hypothetical protein
MQTEVPTVELAWCFLRLADLPNFALDRLSRYETNLWRQAGRILHALEILDRRKPQERPRNSSLLGRESQTAPQYSQLTAALSMSALPPKADID